MSENRLRGLQEEYKRRLLEESQWREEQPKEVLSCSINTEDHQEDEHDMEKGGAKMLVVDDDDEGVEDLENNHLTRDTTVMRPRTIETILIAK